MQHKIKLIILDRDGVINYDSDKYIKSTTEWVPILGSIEAIARLTKNGFKVAVATNQSGIARNYFSINTLNKIHTILIDKVKALGGNIYKIKYCPHHPQDNCFCRKPNPGMLLELLQETNIHSHQTIMLGDSLTDMQAAIAANCHALWLCSGKKDNYFNENADLAHKIIKVNQHKIMIANNLKQFTDAFLAGEINIPLKK